MEDTKQCKANPIKIWFLGMHFRYSRLGRKQMTKSGIQEDDCLRKKKEPLIPTLD